MDIQMRQAFVKLAAPKTKSPFHFSQIWWELFLNNREVLHQKWEDTFSIIVTIGDFPQLGRLGIFRLWIGVNQMDANHHRKHKKYLLVKYNTESKQLSRSVFSHLIINHCYSYLSVQLLHMHELSPNLIKIEEGKTRHYNILQDCNGLRLDGFLLISVITNYIHLFLNIFIRAHNF